MFYFFIVFLPYLPFSIPAIILVGAGFLMLAPLLLFVVHVGKLNRDFIFLKNSYSPKMIMMIAVFGLCVIPTAVTLKYKNDRRVLNDALAYFYAPDYTKEYHLNEKSLMETLDRISEHRTAKNWGDFFNHILYTCFIFVL